MSFQSGVGSISNESKQSSRSKKTDTLYEDKLISPDEFSWGPQSKSSEMQPLSWKLAKTESSVNFFLE